ncbi:MAG: response regulator [Spirochaetales bacterium]|nr:response regulator [Spirochaetales bacterium]
MNRLDDKKRVLVVDDVRSNILTLNEFLKDQYVVMMATSGEKALNLCFSEYKPHVILLDVIMSGMDGYDVCRQLKNREETKDIPIIFITSMNEVADEQYGLELGANDYLRKPVNPEICRIRIDHQLKLQEARSLLKDDRNHLEQLILERSEELNQTQDITIQCIASLAETRDNETGNHIRRTKNNVVLIARELAKNPLYKEFLSEELISILGKSAPLHDVGKIGIPDSILLKPGKLTDEEFTEMKQHTIYGAEALLKAERKLGSNSFLRYATEIALNHHERWDGKGYPGGLSKKSIPLSARIMAVADVYDALISTRCYKKAFPHAKAVEIINEGSGTQFDPLVVSCFNKIKEEIRVSALEFTDTEDQKNALS